MGIKTKLEHFKEGCNCSFEVDLFKWRRRFNVGHEIHDEAWESYYAFIDFGPFNLKLSVGHFVED